MFNNNIETNQYKYTCFISTLSMSLMICSSVLANKLIETPFGILSAASLVSPLWYILGDVITEVYGLKFNLRLFWSVMICQFIFSVLCILLINIKSPLSWDHQSSYNLVFSNFFRGLIFQFIGVTIAWNINARLLAKWKILMYGKYFWLRSVGASGLGLIIFSCLSVFPSVYGLYSLNIVFNVVIWSCVLKIIFLIILSAPSTLVVFLLKKGEGIKENFQQFTLQGFPKTV